ncbi:ABC transporter permease, partial [Candidatus Puniceispirillum sp.]|uniref:ABC transporter permease n=1 Tax=Candidatus Puniceispirillum sp. TaxID=2026719 RepID=UPI003F699626
MMGFFNKDVSETQIKLKDRLWLYIFSILVLFLLIVPSLIVIPMSFSESQYLEFPPKSFSLRWYENYFFSWKVENGFNDWMAATWTSIKVAILTILVATPIGTMAAYGLINSNSRLRSILFPIMISPMMVPVILVAIGLFYFFVQFKMVNSIPGLVLGHSLVAMPLVLIIILSALKNYDMNQ